MIARVLGCVNSQLISAVYNSDLVNYSELISAACHDPNFGNFRASGNDSFVIIDTTSGLCFKIYAGDNLLYMTGGIVKPKILKYRDITNRTSQLARVNNWSIKVPSGGEELQLRVNAFLRIEDCPICGAIVGIAEAIGGLTLWDDCLGLSESGMDNFLSDTSGWINQQVGVRCATLRRENVRVNRERMPTAIITDLAAIISLVA